MTSLAAGSPATLGDAQVKSATAASHLDQGSTGQEWPTLADSVAIPARPRRTVVPAKPAAPTKPAPLSHPAEANPQAPAPAAESPIIYEDEISALLRRLGVLSAPQEHALPNPPLPPQPLLHLPPTLSQHVPMPDAASLAAIWEGELGIESETEQEGAATGDALPSKKKEKGHKVRGGVKVRQRLFKKMQADISTAREALADMFAALAALEQLKFTPALPPPGMKGGQTLPSGSQAPPGSSPVPPPPPVSPGVYVPPSFSPAPPGFSPVATRFSPVPPPGSPAMRPPPGFPPAATGFSPASPAVRAPPGFSPVPLPPPGSSPGKQDQPAAIPGAFHHIAGAMHALPVTGGPMRHATSATASPHALK